jgi:hypothetical protein
MDLSPDRVKPKTIHLIFGTSSHHYHSMGTCATQLTCLRKVCGHVTVSDHRLPKPEGFNVRDRPFNLKGGMVL